MIGVIIIVEVGIVVVLVLIVAVILYSRSNNSCISRVRHGNSSNGSSS